MVAAVSASPNPKGRAEKKTVRPPLLPSDADNGVVPNRRPRPREVTSRYMSPTTSISTTNSGSATSTSSSSSSSSSRRYPSPLVSRTAPMTPMPDSSAAAAIRRSQSVDRRRPATPRPNTPGKSSGEVSAAAKLLVSSKRSLSVSFQGDSFSIPTRTATKPAPATISLSSARRGTPERGRLTPVRDQAENSKPIDPHRWPGRSREVNSTTRSLNCGGDKKRLGGSGNVVRTLQQSMIIDRSKASFDNSNAKLDKVVQLLNDVNSAAGSAAEFDPVASDAESVSSVNGGVVQDCGSVAQVRGGPRGIVVPARFLQETNNRTRRLPEPKSPVSRNNGLRALAPPPIPSPRGVSSSRGMASPIRGAVRPSSPSKPVTPSASSLSRGLLSPSRVKNGVAASTLNHNDLSRTPSILSFAVDVRRGKVGENRVVDAQLLRLLHNRHLQWRFINARADAATMVQKVTAEKSLYNAWVTTSKLWHSVKTKRLELQMLRRNLKLYSILKGQMVYMDDWDPIDQDHSGSLSGLTVALEASTVRLPVVSGARADIQNVKDAICSAVDVMQGMASSICSLVTKVDRVNSVASELANITATERALLDQCNDLLSTLTAMQVKDCSLRSHILQLRSVPSSLTTDL